MKTKAIIFDFDGTLTKKHKLPNSWARVWARINCQSKDEMYYKQYMNGEIDYSEWFKLCYECFKEENVNERDFVEISNEIELIDNLEDYLKFLNEQGIKLYILSGGIGNIIEKKIGHLKKYITSIEADMFLIDENGLLCGISPTQSKVYTKSHFVKHIMSELDIAKDEVVFIGNGLNDEDVYTSGVKTICLNPDCDAHPENKTFWTETIVDCEDIMQTLKFID